MDQATVAFVKSGHLDNDVNCNLIVETKIESGIEKQMVPYTFVHSFSVSAPMVTPSLKKINLTVFVLKESHQLDLKKCPVEGSLGEFLELEFVLRSLVDQELKCEMILDVSKWLIVGPLKSDLTLKVSQDFLLQFQSLKNCCFFFFFIYRQDKRKSLD